MKFIYPTLLITSMFCSPTVFALQKEEYREQPHKRRKVITQQLITHDDQEMVDADEETNISGNSNAITSGQSFTLEDSNMGLQEENNKLALKHEKRKYEWCKEKTTAIYQKIKNTISSKSRYWPLSLTGICVANMVRVGQKNEPSEYDNTSFCLSFLGAWVFGSMYHFILPWFGSQQLESAIIDNNLDEARAALSRDFIYPINVEPFIALPPIPLYIGEKPLETVIRYSRPEMVKLLLENGAWTCVPYDSWAKIRPHDSPTVQQNKQAVQKLLDNQLEMQRKVHEMLMNLKAQKPIVCALIKAIEALHSSMKYRPNEQTEIVSGIVSSYLIPKYLELSLKYYDMSEEALIDILIERIKKKEDGNGQSKLQDPLDQVEEAEEDFIDDEDFEIQ